MNTVTPTDNLEFPVAVHISGLWKETGSLFQNPAQLNVFPEVSSIGSNMSSTEHLIRLFSYFKFLEFQNN